MNTDAASVSAKEAKAGGKPVAAIGAKDRTGAFLLSCLLSATAAHMLNFSVVLYAQQVLHSDLLSGIGLALCFGPPILFGWYAGVICDRRSPIKIVHGAHVAYLLAAAGLFFADRFLFDSPMRASIMMGAAFFVGLGWSFVTPGRLTALGSVARHDKLEKASMAFNLMPIIGFGLAPAILASAQPVIGWQGIFLLAGTLFVVSSLLLANILTPVAQKQFRPVLEDIAAGLHTAMALPVLKQVLISAAVILMIVGPLQVLVIKMARTQFGFGEVGGGSFMAMLAPSIVVGGILCLMLAKHFSYGKALATCTAAAGLLLAALSLVHDRSWAMITLGCIGLTTGFASGIVIATIQAQAPLAFRGRIMSIYGILTQAMPAASGFAAGALSHSLDAPRAVVICGLVIALLATFNVTFMWELRHYRRR